MPEQEDHNEEAPKLRLKRQPDESVAQTEKCPKCGTDVPGDCVLCVQCGYDFRSRAGRKTSTGISHTVAVVAGVIISTIIAAAAIVILVNVFKSDLKPVPAPLTEETPAQPPPKHMAEPEIPVPAEPEEIEPIAAPEPEDVAEEELALDDEEPEDAAVQKVDLEEEQARLRRSLRDSLDDRVPPHLIGDKVALRRLNGFVHRGTLVGIRDGMALVVDGEIRERVPLKELDRDSRLLVDEEFRERLVDSRLRGMLENKK